MVDKTPWTVADLIRCLEQLPPDMEIWYQNVDDFQPITRDLFPTDETSGLSVREGKLVLFYDSCDFSIVPLDRSKIN